jgi:hypothetical protein
MNQKPISQISLEQTLLDFEIANARVLDLTSRLTTQAKELQATRQTLLQTQSELSKASEELGVLKRSKAFRIVRLLGRARRGMSA